MLHCLPRWTHCSCCPEFFGKIEEEEEGSSEDEDYEDEGEEDIDLEDFEEEDEADLHREEEEEETTKMPPKKRATAKKTTKSPARKKAPPRPAPSPPADDTGLEAEMESMSLDNGSRYSTKCIYPLFLYPHFKNRREHCKIEFVVPALPQSSFILKVMPEERNKLQLYTVIPSKLTSEDRLNRTLADEQGFNNDTHQNTAYKKLAGKIKEDHKSEHNPTGRILAGPQFVEIPFECEEQIRFVVDYHRNREMDAVFNERQYMALLAVDLTSIEKPSADAQGGVRIVESEDDDGGGGDEEEMEDEEEADQF